MKRLGLVFFLSVLPLSFPVPQASADGAAAGIPPNDRAWLEEVDPLVTPRERQVFLRLRAEAEREAFIEGFWQARDPFPQTARNEMREQWESRFQEARQRWGGLSDDRSRVFLLQGSPTASFQADCPGTGSYEVWVYEPRFQEKYRMVLVFLRGGQGAPARLWRPGVAGFDPAGIRAEACARGEELFQEARWIRYVGQEPYGALVERVLARPRPREWISGFVPLSFEPTDGAPSFQAGVDVELVGRQQDKMVVRVLLTVPPGSLPPLLEPGVRQVDSEGGDHEFLLAGRVLQNGQQIERFLYRFHAKPQGGRPGQPIPLTFERFLPPGRYTLDIKLEHVATQSVFQARQEVAIPELLMANALSPSPAPETPAVLRARWRIAYQSSNTKTDGAFRAVQVKLAKSGLEARTISGYYP